MQCRFCKDESEVLGMCRKHYDYAHRWHKAGLKRALKHRDKLATRQSIIDDTAASSNIIPIKRRRAA